jgi:hypothetical protein
LLAEEMNLFLKEIALKDQRVQKQTIYPIFKPDIPHVILKLKALEETTIMLKLPFKQIMIKLIVSEAAHLMPLTKFNLLLNNYQFLTQILLISKLNLAKPDLKELKFKVKFQDITA